ncbi:MarR family winged helix-turn-helix transcriptional regulator [Pararhodobacter zhoushanensis]|uniref:MarR family winged helix-turn-helix transcriptional regulator n=1 Tax=Pararhodobacter zhoushanensis TaxID=2479545 RepID=UPI000F8E0767|nr:MarR family winged helix-turn-helix transcriptional regulator [Pararhodobacter zhoushanensis]
MSEPFAFKSRTVSPDFISAPCHTAELLVHLARLVHGSAADPSLTPAQWTALRYFASANRFSRTPSGFSEFNATTRGTASQTVKSLIAMGLLEKRVHESDRRSALIEVTETGRAKLCADPLSDLIECIRALPEPQREALTDTITTLGVALAKRRSAPTFGQCGDCGHCDAADSDESFCHCTQQMLSGIEMKSLCIDFAPTKGPKR